MSEDTNDDDFDEFDVPDWAENEDESEQGGNKRSSEQKRLDAKNEDLETYSNSEELGHIIASRDLRISRIEDNNSIFAYVHTNDRDEIRTGNYIQLPYPGESHAELFGVIRDLSYAHRSEANDQQDFAGGMGENGGIEERQYTFIAKINPIAILEGSHDDLTAGQVDRIPKPETYIYPSDDETCLRTGLNIPAEGPFVGYMSVGGEKQPKDNPLPFRLPDDDEDGEPAIFRHGIVGGSTGKGKTHFMKNLLRQYATDARTYNIEVEEEGEMGADRQTVRKQLGTVIIDPENEYSELGEDNPDYPDFDESLDELDGESINDLRDKGIEVGGINDQSGSQDLRTYVPDVSRTTYPNVKDSYEFSIPFSIVRGRRQLMMPFDAEGPTRDALEKSINEFFTQADNGAFDGRYAEFERFVKNGRDWANAENPEDDPDISRAGKWVEQYGLNGNSMNAVYRRISHSAYTRVFDNGAEPITELTHEMFKPGRTTVIPTNHLTGRKENLVVMSILALIVDNKLDGYEPDKHINDTPLLLVLDEAHSYLSEPNADDVQAQYVVNKYRLAARQGRKYKLGMFNITQNPADIDPEIIKQTNTSIYLGLEPEVIDEINVPGNYADAMSTFGKGQAVAKAPDVRPVEVLGLPICLTKHSK